MPEPAACRLIHEEPGAGAWNMAVDEVLLETAGRTGEPAWRFYRWVEPTLSLGYFQRYEDRGGHAASRNCAAVRRVTGGGAILHDRELTYSIALPQGHVLARRRLDLYRAVHEALVDTLAETGISARICASTDERAGGQPFLCFQRHAAGDVLAGVEKVAGSAQRRSATAVLQHGSVLLGRSTWAPELPGLAELADQPVEEAWLVEHWLERLSRALGFCWRVRPLTDRERAAAAALARSTYGSAVWTVKRRRGDSLPLEVPFP